MEYSWRCIIRFEHHLKLLLTHAIIIFFLDYANPIGPNPILADIMVENAQKALSLILFFLILLNECWISKPYLHTIFPRNNF